MVALAVELNYDVGIDAFASILQRPCSLVKAIAEADISGGRRVCYEDGHGGKLAVESVAFGYHSSSC